MIGKKVVHHMMMSEKDAHYVGGLVNGARIVVQWGDVGTELMVYADGDISLFLGYEKIEFIKSMCSNYVGLLWGMCIIMSGNINSGILFGAIVTGAFSCLICYQSKIDLLSLVPNTFMGGFSAFASGGDWKMLCICLVLGNILGVCCDYSGRFLAAKFGKDN